MDTITKNKMKIKLITISVIIVLIIVICAIFININRISDKDDLVVTPQKLYMGYHLGEAIVGKPRVHNQDIFLECMSFVPKGEKTIVDVALGQDYTDYYHFEYGEELSSRGSYEHFGENVYPLFKVHENMEKKSNKGIFNFNKKSKLIINEKREDYSRKYNIDEMVLLDTEGIQNDFAEYYHESVELDFGKYKEGDYGTIDFEFYWYDENNPENTNGIIRPIYFYVIKSGVVLAEREMNNYSEVESVVEYYEENLCFNISDHISKETDSDIKPDVRLIDQTDNLKQPNYNKKNYRLEYSHGSLIEERFVITGSYHFRESRFKVTIEVSEGVELLSESDLVVRCKGPDYIPVNFKMKDGYEQGVVTITANYLPDEKNSVEGNYHCRKVIYCYNEGDIDYRSLVKKVS